MLPPVIRVAIASERFLVRAGLRWILEREADFAVVGEFDQTNCLDSADDLEAHVLIVHLENIDATTPSLPDATVASILVLTAVKPANPDTCGTAADCYLSTDVGRNWFLQAIRDLAYKPGFNQRSLDVESVRNLSERERQILDLIAAGHTNKEVAKQLNLSVRTVENHRSRIKSKLGALTRADLVGRLNALKPYETLPHRRSLESNPNRNDG